jgi:alpha-glucosidase
MRCLWSLHKPAVVFVSVAFLLAGAAVAQESLVVRSPDGKIEATLHLGPPAAGTASCLSYSVTYEGKPLLLDSPLEFRLEGVDGLLTELTAVKTDREAVDQTWQRVWGKCKTVRDHYNEMRVTLESKGRSQRRLAVIWRAYDDGVAFRYSLPVQSQIKKFKLTEERSQFRFAGDHTVWAADYGQFTTHQEAEFAEGKLSGLKPGGIYGLPLTGRACTSPPWRTRPMRYARCCRRTPTMRRSASSPRRLATAHGERL